METMENTLAIANITLMGAGVVYTWRKVKRPQDRRIAYFLCGAALAVTGAGLVWFVPLDGDIGVGLVWLLYIGGGLVVLGAIVAALRGGGATRFAWRTGRYQRYKQYRRVV